MPLDLVEKDTETIIDYQLRNLKWIVDPKSKDRNVFKQNVKTKDQKQALGGKRPDYVLYRSNSNEPLIVIEAKRPNKNIKAAIEQGSWYAEKIKAPIVYATDGVYTKTLHRDIGKPLFKNGEELDEFIREIQALQYLKSNELITLDREVISSRQELIKIFDSANKLLRQEGLEVGLDRFREFSNILFLKLISELENIKEEEGDAATISKEFRWDYFKQKKGNELLSYVNHVVLRKFKSKYDDDTIFEDLQIQDPKVLEKIIDKLDPLNLTDINSDIKGDAFEYFLSKYTAQNNTDLGEYFTPRHIVKTCVKLANPQIGETVYDPFCGTGGMLIESFKHIHNNIAQTDMNMKNLKQNTIFGNEITKNARITKMNMILMGDGHNNIQRKDSLKSLSEHENQYDIVITNMPFSQKTEYGNLYDIPTNNGDSICLQHCIKSIKKKASNGRAVIIVSEGILFDEKYKKLKEWVFQKSDLQNIISLPAGAFKPYTETKTNILFFKNVNNPMKNRDIWYFDVKNDGYTLNVKRKRKEGTSDLEIFLSERNCNADQIKNLNKIGFTLLKHHSVKENGYNLLPSQYKEYEYKSKFQIVEFNQILEETNLLNENQQHPVWSVTNNQGFILSEERFKERVASENTSHYKIVKENYFAYNPSRVNVGSLCFNNSKNIGAVSPMYVVFKVIDENTVFPKYLFLALKNKKIFKKIQESCFGSVRQTLNFNDLLKLKTPLPHLEEQKQTVVEIEDYQKIIDGARQVMAVWKPHIKIDPDWPMVDLGEIADLKYGFTDSAKGTGDTTFIRITDIDKNGYIKSDHKKYINLVKEAKQYILQKNDILIARTGATYGKTAIFSGDYQAVYASYLIRAQFDQKKVLHKFYWLYAQGNYYWEQARGLVSGSGQPQFNANVIKQIKIPLPPLEEQKEIVSQLEKEEAIINQNKELIKIMEKKMEDRINQIWEQPEEESENLP